MIKTNSISITKNKSKHSKFALSTRWMKISIWQNCFRHPCPLNFKKKFFINEPINNFLYVFKWKPMKKRNIMKGEKTKENETPICIHLTNWYFNQLLCKLVCARLFCPPPVSYDDQLVYLLSYSFSHFFVSYFILFFCDFGAYMAISHRWVIIIIH